MHGHIYVKNQVAVCAVWRNIQDSRQDNLEVEGTLLINLTPIKAE